MGIALLGKSRLIVLLLCLESLELCPGWERNLSVYAHVL